MFKTGQKSYLVFSQIIGITLLTMTAVLLTGCMSIHTAASAGNVAEVKKQLAWGISPNSGTFWYQRSPLHYAAAYGRIRVVELLLEKGANVNITNEGGETPLHYATKHGHTKVMEILLENGADVTQKGTGCGTPLQWAARNGQVNAARILLDAGADVCNKGTSSECLPLIDAVGSDQIEMVAFLLSKGANVNAKASYNRTPLFIAVCRRNVELASLLLETGAEANIMSNGRTALIASVLNDDVKMTELLLAHGANVNTQSEYHSTPLYIAYRRDNIEIGQILLQHGAEPTIKNDDGGKIPQSFIEQLRK